MKKWRIPEWLTLPTNLKKLIPIPTNSIFKLFESPFILPTFGANMREYARIQATRDHSGQVGRGIQSSWIRHGTRSPSVKWNCTCSYCYIGSKSTSPCRIILPIPLLWHALTWSSTVDNCTFFMSGWSPPTLWCLSRNFLILSILSKVAFCRTELARVNSGLGLDGMLRDSWPDVNGVSLNRCQKQENNTARATDDGGKGDGRVIFLVIAIFSLLLLLFSLF